MADLAYPNIPTGEIVTKGLDPSGDLRATPLGGTKFKTTDNLTGGSSVNTDWIPAAANGSLVSAFIIGNNVTIQM